MGHDEAGILLAFGVLGLCDDTAASAPAPSGSIIEAQVPASRQASSEVLGAATVQVLLDPGDKPRISRQANDIE
jgi:hypothetical protein